MPKFPALKSIHRTNIQSEPSSRQIALAKEIKITHENKDYFTAIALIFELALDHYFLGAIEFLAELHNPRTQPKNKEAAKLDFNSLGIKYKMRGKCYKDMITPTEDSFEYYIFQARWCGSLKHPAALDSSEAEKKLEFFTTITHVEELPGNSGDLRQAPKTIDETLYTIQSNNNEADSNTENSNSINSTEISRQNEENSSENFLSDSFSFSDEHLISGERWEKILSLLKEQPKVVEIDKTFLVFKKVISVFDYIQKNNSSSQTFDFGTQATFFTYSEIKAILDRLDLTGEISRILGYASTEEVSSMQTIRLAR